MPRLTLHRYNLAGGQLHEALAAGAGGSGRKAMAEDENFSALGARLREHTVVDSQPRMNTLAFQVDLWSARGELPRTLVKMSTRKQEIQYSSRTRAGTDNFKEVQRLRRAMANLFEKTSRSPTERSGGRAAPAGCRSQGLQHRGAHLSRQEL